MSEFGFIFEEGSGEIGTPVEPGPVIPPIEASETITNFGICELDQVKFVN